MTSRGLRRASGPIAAISVPTVSILRDRPPPARATVVQRRGSGMTATITTRFNGARKAMLRAPARLRTW